MISQNGDTHTWVLEAENESNVKCYSAKIEFVIPAGVSLIGPSIEGSTGITVPKGAYNPVSKTWFIGDMEALQKIEAPFTFRVDDIDLIDPIEKWFEITATISSSCIDPEDCDNVTHLLLQSTGPCLPIDLSAGPEPEDLCCNEEVNLSIG